MQRFLAIEASGSILLVLATLVALVWANSSWRAGYDQVWHTSFGPDVGVVDLHQSLLHWVNDGLMATFFFVVGLEIKREWVSGELRDRRAAALPMFAAFGGMVTPALLFVVLTSGTDGSSGWGIPMATDIAFAVGVLALLGSRVPPALKVFLLTLAIVDDIGAIAVIAVVYSGPLALGWVLGALGLIALVLLARRSQVTSAWVYLVLGVVLWVCVLSSGVHATIAGVAMGLLVPSGDGRWEERLHPWTSNAVVPLFALANAGIALALDTGSAAAGRVGLAVGVGLVGGKTLGVAGFAWLAHRAGVGRLPAGVRWSQLLGAAILAGIGFTVSLFIAGLAYDAAPLVQEAKVGILFGSLVAAAGGSLVLWVAGRRVLPRTSGQTRRA